MKYDYLKHLKEDIRKVLDDYDYDWYADVETQYEQLYDNLWVDDSVTGNGSGSYTFSKSEARKNLVGNEDVLVNALDEFCGDYKRALQDPEYADVTIRCYLLNSALYAVLKEL